MSLHNSGRLMKVPQIPLLCLCYGALAFSQHSNEPDIWHGETVNDLHKEYANIFKYGNRNAASHLWSTFLLDRSSQMSEEKFELMFSGYCAISGSPVRPNDYNRCLCHPTAVFTPQSLIHSPPIRYMLNLEAVSNDTRRMGYLHFCCWPCVCDTQDFIKVDTRTVALRGGGKAPVPLRGYW